MNLIFENTVHFSYDKVVKNIGQDMFLALNPPWNLMKLVRFDGTKVSDEVHLEMKLGIKKVLWISKIVKSELSEIEFNFVDIGVKVLPGMKSWHHQHIFRKIGEDKTLIIDNISFETSNSVLDQVYRNLVSLQFFYRKFGYKNFLSQI